MLGAQVTFWGEPGNEVHDPSRSWPCLREGIVKNIGEVCAPPQPRPSGAFLTLPTSCAGALNAQMAGVAWTGESLGSEYSFLEGLGNPLQRLEGCQQVPFNPAHRRRAGAARGRRPPRRTRQLGQHADRPRRRRQTAAADDPGIRHAGRVRRPERDRDPATGRRAQSLGRQRAAGVLRGADRLSRKGCRAIRSRRAPKNRCTSRRAEAQCPGASKVGTVRISTPLLSEELTGSVYLAAQEAEPVRLADRALHRRRKPGARPAREARRRRQTRTKQTGQITTTFNGHAAGPLRRTQPEAVRRPARLALDPCHLRLLRDHRCLQPWSGSTHRSASSCPEPFQITSGPGGTPCPRAHCRSPRASGRLLKPAGRRVHARSRCTIGHPDGDQPLTLDHDAPAGRDRGDARLGHAVPRTTGRH